jgi:hypothetical protein
MKRLALVAVFLACGAAAHAQSFNYNGFSPSTGLQSNGTNQFVSNGTTTVARLTTKTGNQAGSFFTASQYDITRFTSTFRIQFTDDSAGSSWADGMCFVIQRAGPTALGGTGGALGYTGGSMANSVAVKFDIYSGLASYTGSFQNGTASPEVTISPNIDFHSFRVFEVVVTYDAVDLVVTITDTVSNNTDTRTYPMDIPAVIGGTTAHLGFTAATGGQTAIQDVLTFSFATVFPTPAPTNVVATDTLENQVVITWTGIPNAISYEVFYSTSATGPWTSVAIVNAPTTTYTHNVAPGTYYYMVRATDANGVSADSNVDQGRSLAPPRTNNHDEGLLNSDCACGSSAGAGPGLAAFAALTLLLAFRRR